MKAKIIYQDRTVEFASNEDALDILDGSGLSFTYRRYPDQHVYRIVGAA